MFSGSEIDKKTPGPTTLSLHLSGSKEARSLKPNLQRTAQVAVDQDALFVFQSLRLADFGSSEPVDLLSSLSSLLHDLASRLGCVAFSPPSKRIEGLGYRRLLLLSSTATFFCFIPSGQVHPTTFSSARPILLSLSRFLPFALLRLLARASGQPVLLGPFTMGWLTAAAQGGSATRYNFHIDIREQKREAVGRYY